MSTESELIHTAIEEDWHHVKVLLNDLQLGELYALQSTLIHLTKSLGREIVHRVVENDRENQQ